MPSTTPNGPSPDHDRLRDLFHRASALPPAEREAFVRREAADDPRLAEQALRRLAYADAPSERLRAAVSAATPADEPFEDDQAPVPDDQVQPTPTDELLQKLTQTPRLDARRFALERLIGEGGMGAVYRVHDQHLNRHLAVKRVLPENKSDHPKDRSSADDVLGRFLEEAQVTSQLDHPGVIPVYELGLDQHGDVFFMMRQVKGRTASKVFADAHARRNEWSLTRALEVVLKVCDTMSYAHARGVLHRDLKPKNVMVGRFGEVYVLDWGVAKVRGQADRHDERLQADAAGSAAIAEPEARGLASTGRTRQGSALGTPNYMSPEQARGDFRSLDERADVYAIGAMLYQLLTGAPPYAAGESAPGGKTVRQQVIAGPPPSVESLQPGVPAELVAIVGKAMARDREQRYRDTASLAADVRAFLGSQVVSAYRTGALVELQLWVKRNKPLAASLAAAVLILVAGIVVSRRLANEMTALAKEKTALAKSESEAKEKAAELAASEGRAKAEAQRTVGNFNQLSAVVRLEDAIAKQDTLWPAWPDKIAALQEWLDKDCAELLKQRPQIEATIAEQRSKALPLTAERVEADRRAAPEWPQYERQQQLVASLHRAQSIRAGTSNLELPELPASLQNADASALNSFAWQRVAPEKPEGEEPERTKFGEEAEGLVAAWAALEKGIGQERDPYFLDTLAWAALANGQDAEAKRRIAEALAQAPAAERESYLGYQRAIEVAIAEAPTRLAAAVAKLGALEAKVSEHRTWKFGDDDKSRSAEFLHNALMNLVSGLNSMTAKERTDVAQRLSWAQQVCSASLAHPKARATWAAAREAIAKADDVVASKRYGGLSIPLADELVIGLVPIGMNPVTKLWEFYDLRSAWDGKQAATEIEIPTQQADGSIAVKAGTGIIFVLLPGGTVRLGSQKDDPSAPFYDPHHRDDEMLYEVVLSPFFLARHELTQGQWSRLWTWDADLQHPSTYKASRIVDGKRITLANPVELV